MRFTSVPNAEQNSSHFAGAAGLALRAAPRMSRFLRDILSSKLFFLELFTSSDSNTLSLRRALSPTFPAGEMVFFIPWRVVAEESGAAHLDLLGPPGWCSGCWPHDGEVAGGAVADSTLVIFRFGATMELGRSERTTMRPLWSYRVDGADTPDRKPR
jgi:hypothetical protein